MAEERIKAIEEKAKEYYKMAREAMSRGNKQAFRDLIAKIDGIGEAVIIMTDSEFCLVSPSYGTYKVVELSRAKFGDLEIIR